MSIGIKGKWVIAHDGAEHRLLRDGVLLTIDEARRVKEVQRVTEAIWARIPENHYLGQSSDEVSPQSFKPCDP